MSDDGTPPEGIFLEDATTGNRYFIPATALADYRLVGGDAALADDRPFDRNEPGFAYDDEPIIATSTHDDSGSRAPVVQRWARPPAAS